MLDAAHALLSEGGISAVTMSKVAKALGVSSGAPYRHFRDRADLLRALADRAQHVLAERLERAVASAPNPLEGFRRSGVEYVRFAVDEPALFNVMGRGEFASRDTKEGRDSDHAFVDDLERLLTSGDTTAALDPSDPVLQQLAARCMVHGLAHYFVDGLLATLGIDESQAGRVAEALTRALGPPSI